MSMAMLILAALLWVAVHVGLAGTALRGRLVTRLGEGGFRLAFSLASVVTIVALVAGYNAAPTTPLWVGPDWLRWLLALVMLAAFILFAASLRGNPTAVGGEAGLAAEPRGIQRITRHPMLWSFALWAAVHVAANGDSASMVFFGAFLLTALVGMPSIDAKLARRRPQDWALLAAATSILPFGAVLAGRNRFVPAELWVPTAIGAGLWIVLLHLHPAVFGVPAVSF
jgi:uncharacterized membrane protein